MVSPSRRFRVAVLCAAAALDTRVQHAMGELVLLVTVTRHGSRAPNTVIDELCPKNQANRLAYNVPPGQLTENGMKQALELGKFLRETYVETLGFLPPTLGTRNEPGFSSAFMSDAAERCLMTAQAMAQGLFPNGTGPPGFPNQPVPVQTNQKQFDNLLAAAHGACLLLQKADNMAFDESRGVEIIAEHKNLTDIVTEACGVPLESYAEARSGKEGVVLGVKDVSDMIDFDDQQGLERLPAITDDVKTEMTALAFQLLQERYYSTPQQITYWAGDLPGTLLKDLRAAVTQHAEGAPQARLYLGYHAHRELLYGLAHVLGWSFNVQGMPTALGTTAIPPGTTMFFELHHRSEETDGGSVDLKSNKLAVSNAPDIENGYYYVRTFTWTPEFGQQEVVLDACKNEKAGKGCLLETVAEIIERRIVDFGTWQDICHHVPFDQAEKLAQQHVFDPSARGQGNIPRKTSMGLVEKVSAVAAVAAAAILCWLGMLVVRKKWLARQNGDPYESVP